MLRKTGKHPGVPSVDRGNWGWECDRLFYRVFALRDECCVLWRIAPHTFISPTKMTIPFGTVRSTNDYAWKPAKWAKFMLLLTRYQISHVQVRTTKTLWLPTWKTNYNAEKCASDVTKMKNRRKQNSKVRQTTCIWIKKILDEATWMINVFLISCFFYLFLLCSISLHVKYNFILRYEAWVSVTRASSFIENVPQISTKRIALQRNLLLLEAPRNWPFFTNRFSAGTGLENSREIGCFFREFDPENPAKFDFFFRDLPEALD